ncbi:MAG: hypothetical protein COA85_03480, partial [Robiginitomaculum sp.]
MKRLTVFAAFVFLAMSFSTAIHATEFLVNTATANDQKAPSVAALSGGGFVVSWADLSVSGGDTSAGAIRAQRYDVSGVAQGGEFLVNTSIANDQKTPSGAALSGGGFVITWQDLSNGVDFDIRAQRYNATGVAQGGEFLVNTTTPNNQSKPRAGALPSGGFVIVWWDFGSTSGDIQAQRYNAAGVAQGGEFLVNTTTVSFQTRPSVAGLTGGGFVVAWQDSSAGPADIRAQRYNASGAAQGAEFLVNTITTNNQENPSVAELSGGGFIITWSDNSTTSGDIRAQRYNASGVAQGGEFLVNTTTPSAQQNPRVAALTGGGFVIAWEDNSLSPDDPSGLAVRAQRYNATGAPQGSEFIINTTTANSQQNPSIAGLTGGGGDVAIVWQDLSVTGGDTSSAAIRGDIFIFNDAPTGAVIISGTAAQGQTLTADASAVADVDGLGAFTYQWQRNGVNRLGQNDLDYLLTQADVGATITVAVDYTDGGGKRESVVSAATTAVANTNDAPTGAVVISGTLMQGQSLSADASTVSDVDGLGPFSYQWKRGGSNIAGAMGTTYTLVQGDVGSTITVTISYTDGFGAAESVTSSVIGPVSNTNDAPTGTVMISGTPMQGQTLSADASTVSDVDGLGPFAFQWRRVGTDITGADATTYVLVAADAGKTIDVVVSYTDGFGTSESLTSAPTGVIAAGSTTLFSSVLPSARAGFFPGGPVITVFASVINAGSNLAQNCQINIPASSPVTLSYQETDASNVPTGIVDAPFNIAAG